MVTSRQLKRLATNPAAHMRFLSTGKLPEGVKPRSPLIDLLETIGPTDRCRITNLVVDQRLGYAGSRSFANAEQAYRWVKPSEEVFGTFPAETWRVKSFAKKLTLDDLAGCAVVPELLVGRQSSRSGMRNR